MPGIHRAYQMLAMTGDAGLLERRILKKLYVGNLPFSATEAQISELFGKHGTVHSVA